jgi:hypothetical protein
MIEEETDTTEEEDKITDMGDTQGNTIMDIGDSEATEPEFMAATKATTDPAAAAVVAAAFVVAAAVVESVKIRNEMHHRQFQPRIQLSSHGTVRRLINSII